ncbi:MAG: serine hydrolase domain-containing protein [Myxococcota bacterium]
MRTACLTLATWLGLLLAAPGFVACSGSDNDGAGGPFELTAERRAAFSSELEAARQRLEVPGVAYAIVAHGQVLEVNGLGVRDLATLAPVTADTVFRVGSITKAMSSALIASHVDEGALAWDTLATSIDPGFKLTDDALTKSVTLAELLGMGTGLNAPPPFWWEYQTADDVMAAVSLATKTVPRGTFIYNNEAYATGVYLGLRASGATGPLVDAYAGELETRVFAPLGMKAAVSDDPATVGEDYAKSYMPSLVDKLSADSETPPFALRGLSAAGAVVTSAAELAKFLIAEMQQGLGANGARIASAENIRRTQLGQTPWTRGFYGMGWVIENELSVPLLWHDGSIDGFRTLMLSLPKAEVGLVVLSNGATGDRLCAVARAAFMRAVHGKSSIPAGKVETLYEADRAALADTVSKLKSAVDATALAPYIGKYEHGVEVALHEDGSAWLVAPGVEGRLLDASAVTAPGVMVVGSGQFVGNFVQVVGSGAGDPRLEFVNSDLKPVTVLHKLAE